MKKGVLITILVIIMIFVFLTLMGGYIYMQFTREPNIPSNAYLQLNLNDSIEDCDTSAISKKTTFRDLWYHINRAKIDNRIKGIYLKISYLSTGFARIEDIGRLLKDFRSSGKKVYAFIEGGGLGGYYLSTFADKTFVFKGGEIFLKGLATEAMFLKNTLSKLGVQADMYHIGEYKTAYNMFTKDHMTPAHKEAMEKLLTDIYDSIINGISANRNLNPEDIRALIDESPFSNQAYLDARLIDGILYEDEVLNMMKDNPEDEAITVALSTYKQTTDPLPFDGMKKIAVIFAAGEIHSGSSGGKSLFGSDVMGSDTVAAQLKAVRENRFIKAVVLRVDSPGGSALASDVIRREVELLAKEKPVVISMSNLAASGGYWLSMSSTKILALPQTITGSIGVVSGKFVLKGLYNKVGITKESLKTSKYATMFSDYSEFTPEEREKLLGIMNYLYQNFLEIVAKDRKMEVEDVDKIARGRVWAGNTAFDLKLVDQLGGMEDAVTEAKKLAKIGQDEAVGIDIYPQKRSVVDVIMDFLGTDVKANAPVLSLEAKVDQYKSFFPALIMPYVLKVQ